MKITKMNIFLLILLSIFSAATFLYAKPAENPDATAGYWFTENNKAKIQIYRSGEKYYGKIVWLKNPNQENGQPKLDKNNPDKSLRNRPIVGLKLLRNFIHAGGNSWEDGEIYDPESGNDYSCKLSLINHNTLEVRGYLGISLLGRTQKWTRAK
ncbi:MAG: DUF2147 domain-containing protein [Bacteroidia bacterium]